MKSHLNFICGFLLATFCWLGCASVQTYRYYGMEITPECYDKGQMLGKMGKDGWPDMPLKECAPDAAGKHNCVLELRADHFNKQRDLNNCQSDLIACQKACPNG